MYFQHLSNVPIFYKSLAFDCKILHNTLYNIMFDINILNLHTMIKIQNSPIKKKKIQF